MKFQVFICSIVLFLSGCFSLSRVIAPNGNEHIHASNFGWYLFHSIPLATGNTTPNSIMPFALFRNDVTMDKIQSRVFSAVESKHKEPSNISYVCHDEIFFELPGTNIPVPLPYIITYREIQLSGELK